MSLQTQRSTSCGFEKKLFLFPTWRSQTCAWLPDLEPVLIAFTILGICDRGILILFCTRFSQIHSFAFVPREKRWDKWYHEWAEWSKEWAAAWFNIFNITYLPISNSKPAVFHYWTSYFSHHKTTKYSTTTWLFPRFFFYERQTNSKLFNSTLW